ncbi:MAG: hypothetical protein QOH96_4370 [Blastocatellia bacterium]|jgi:PAS domain S-box-containing protein|nr:hypothetical protein [Blastocatellia bacterium]
MKPALRKSKQAPPRVFAPYFVLAITLIFTFLTTYYVWSTSITKDRLQFQNNIGVTTTSIETRIETYASALRSGAVLFSATGATDRATFHNFARGLDIRNRYPGFEGIGYIAVIKPNEKEAVIASMRAQGVPGFTILPESERTEYTAVLFIEPLDRRTPVIVGHDMFTDPVRRVAMEQARDTGEPAGSATVALDRDADGAEQPGFLIYAPVYKKGLLAKNDTERRSFLVGFVFGLFNAQDLLEGIPGPQQHRNLNLQVYDGDQSPVNLLYSSNVGPDDSGSHFSGESKITFAGRKWTLAFASRPEFEFGSGRYLVPVSLAVGLLFSFVLFGVTRSQAKARSVAESAAKHLLDSQLALSENEARLRRLVDANIIGVVIADFSGRVIEANDAFLEIVAYTREDLESGDLSWTALLLPEHEQLDALAMAEMRQYGRHPPFENEYRRKDGTLVPVMIGSAYLGGASELFVGFLLNLTERRRSEAAVREADQRALSEYERLLERLTALAQAFGTARDLVAIYRALRDFAVASVPCAGVFISLYDERREVCRGVYAWGDGEEIDVSVLEPLPVSGDGANSKAVKTGQVVILDDYMTSPEAHSIVLVGTRNGLHPGSAMAAPLSVMGRIIGTMEVQSYESEAYKPEHVVAMNMASSLAAVAIENVQLLERESNARTQAEESNRMKDEFLATVSHELRTPLTSILGWARMLMMGGFDEAAISRAIETIERNATSQARLIDDILEVSRVITGKLKLELKPVEFGGIVAAAVNSVRPTAEAKGIKLNVDLTDKEHIVSGDADRLQQVVWNLLSNAVKFTASGGEIEVALKSDLNDVLLVVKDTGLGISSGFLPYVFDRFRQADSSITRNHGGLGLGLSIVRHLVELHGGSVAAKSEGENLGSTFIVYLPLAKIGSKRPDLVNGLNAPEQKRTSLLRGLNILVVDDEPDTIDMLEAILVRNGAAIIKATSAVEALGFVAACEPDIIISDIGMPEKDGYELIRQIRGGQRPEARTIPAIALTAYVRENERLMALSAGYQEHLAKPVDPEILIETIAGLANGKIENGE